MNTLTLWSFSGPYFPIFSANTGKYRPGKTPYSDTFHTLHLLTAASDDKINLNKAISRLKKAIKNNFKNSLYLNALTLKNHGKNVNYIYKDLWLWNQSSKHLHVQSQHLWSIYKVHNKHTWAMSKKIRKHERTVLTSIYHIYSQKNHVHPFLNSAEFRSEWK